MPAELLDTLSMFGFRLLGIVEKRSHPLLPAKSECDAPFRFIRADSLIFYIQMHVLQFLDFIDRNRVRSLSLIDGTARPHVFP
jgi:hypothetical protein